MNLFSLKNKTALVTGGNGHLGSAMAQGLISAGATVYVLGRDEKKFKTLFENEPLAKWVECDLTSEVEIEKSAKKLENECQNLDILVNNALSAPHWTQKPDEKRSSLSLWNEAIQGGLSSSVALTQAVLPLLLKSKTGASIINIGSMYGLVSPDFKVYTEHQTPSPDYYGAAKAGLIQWTRYLACQLGPSGIRVNCVSPGPFPKKQVIQSDPVFAEKLAQKTPLNRLGQPEELAGILIYLASSASSYVTGQNISVDGGWTAW